MAQPMVTIIALCFNQAKYVVQTLESITAQTYNDIELIIVDDASSDESVQVIKEWIETTGAPCRFISHEANKGICASINEALAISSGKYFQVLACDDIILPFKISRQVAVMESDPSLGFVYSDAYFMNEKGSWKDFGPKFIQSNTLLYDYPPKHIFKKLLLEKNFIPAPSVLVRTACVSESGGYDESLSFEDFDMWLRISKQHSVYFMDEPTCLYRIHTQNMTTALQTNKKHLVTLFDILYKHINISRETDAAIERRLYGVLKQLFYSRYEHVNVYARKFYMHFKKDKNLQHAMKIPFLQMKMYTLLSRLRPSK